VQRSFWVLLRDYARQAGGQMAFVSLESSRQGAVEQMQGCQSETQSEHPQADMEHAATGAVFDRADFTAGQGSYLAPTVSSHDVPRRFNETPQNLRRNDLSGLL